MVDAYSCYLSVDGFCIQLFEITALLEILDGHTRNKICLYAKLTPKFKVMRFENKLLEKKFVIESNLKRRHLNNYQKIELGIPLLEIERQRSITSNDK